jgi:hypothetical protein
MESGSEQPTEPVDDATTAPARLPAMGAYEGLAPLHTLPFAIETNVSRIAGQIAEGRPVTYD